MSDTRFRLLLVLYAALLVAAFTVGFLPGGYSQELADAYANEPEVWLFRNDWAALGLVIPFLGIELVGFVGLFWLRSWARTLSLYSTLLGGVLYPFMGPRLTSSLEGTLFELSAILWGAILALAYCSPISERMSANKSFTPNPLRGSAYFRR